MFRQQRVRPALLSTLVMLLLGLTGVSIPGTSISQVTTSSPAGAPRVSAAPPCDLAVPFNASNFPNSPNFNNPFYPLAPGTQFILQGVANDGSGLVPHQVIFTVTDLTKVIHGVRTVVLWDRDLSEGQLVEEELAFHAQDNAGNIWNLGEYPAQYSGGVFTGAPDTWISGLANAQGGMLLPGNPQEGTPIFLQAYAPDIIGDCGQVSKTGQRVCNVIGCYDNVLVIDETSPPEPGIQQKFYAPGVGNFQIGAVNDPQGETLVLSETVRLSRDQCIAARERALAMEAQANLVSSKVYGKTPPLEQTGFCETIQPTATPPTETPSVSPTPPTETPSVSPTPVTPTPTLPTPTPPQAPDRSVYLPVAARAPVTRPVYNGCRDDPDPALAPNFPVRIVNVDKVKETVTLQNVSNTTISLEDWNMCSLNGNQDHDQIFGTIAAGQMRTFPNIGGSPIWNDNERDDGALYNAAGFLVSYWIDR